MRTYQFIITCESPEFQPNTTLHGEIADRIARTFLQGVRITRLRIENVDEPEAELIDAALCDCVAVNQC